jgi:hypothetical protein
MEKTKCTVKGCPNEGRYCRLHLSGTLKENKPIAKRSVKLEARMKKQYRPQVKEMIKAGTKCRVKSPVCVKVASGFHHLQGRDGENLTGEKKVPCCDPCNSFIEQNDAWARANGWKLSKFQSPSKNQKILIKKN